MIIMRPGDFGEKVIYAWVVMVSNMPGGTSYACIYCASISIEHKYLELYNDY